MGIEAEIRDRATKGMDSAGDGTLGEFAHFMRCHLDCGAVIIRIADRFWPLFAQQPGDLPQPLACALAHELTTQPVCEAVLPDPGQLVDPLVASDMGFGFYAGLPLRLSSGESAGMLAAIDIKARELAANELAILRMLASIIVQMIEFRLATGGTENGADFS